MRSGNEPLRNMVACGGIGLVGDRSGREAVRNPVWAELVPARRQNATVAQRMRAPIGCRNYTSGEDKKVDRV